MIVDTSVWISALRGVETPETNLLRDMQDAGARIAMLPVIYQEILQGAKDEFWFRRYEDRLADVPIDLVLDPIGTARLAAHLYMHVRQAGKTIRSPHDCLIAASCIHLGLPLLHNDRDFEDIAAVTTMLDIIPVPPP